MLYLFPRAAFFEQVPVSDRTTTVLRWASTGSTRANRIRLPRIDGEHAFDANVMLPEVAHVVFIDEVLTRPYLEDGKHDLVRVVVKAHTAATGDAIRFAIDTELMQMQVLPAHGYLQDVMQLGDSRVAGYQQATPDHGGNVAQRDLKLI